MPRSGSVSLDGIGFQACSFNHSDICCAHELHAFGGEPSGPQPHSGFIEVFSQASLRHRHGEVEGAGEDAEEMRVARLTAFPA